MKRGFVHSYKYYKKYLLDTTVRNWATNSHAVCDKGLLPSPLGDPEC